MHEAADRVPVPSDNHPSEHLSQKNRYIEMCLLSAFPKVAQFRGTRLLEDSPLAKEINMLRGRGGGQKFMIKRTNIQPPPLLSPHPHICPQSVGELARGFQQAPPPPSSAFWWLVPQTAQHWSQSAEAQKIR